MGEDSAVLETAWGQICPLSLFTAALHRAGHNSFVSLCAWVGLTWG